MVKWKKWKKRRWIISGDGELKNIENDKEGRGSC